MRTQAAPHKTPSAPFAVRAEDLPGILPVFPLSGVLLLPRGRLPLNIFEPRYLAMIEEALANKRLIGMIQPAGDAHGHGEEERKSYAGLPGLPRLFQVGCAGRIQSFNETDDGRILITLCGVARFRIVQEVDMHRGFRRVRVDWGPYLADLDPAKPCLIDRSTLLEHLRRYFNLQGIASEWDMIEKTDDEKLITSLAMVCPFSPCEKQALLEAMTVEECCRLLNALMDMAALEGDDDSDAARH